MTTPSKRRARPGLLLAVGLLVGLLLLLGTRYREVAAERRSFEQAPAPSAPAGQAARTAALISGQPSHWQPRVALTGTLLPIRESSLSFKVTGRLANVRVDIGDSVKAGQKLAELDAAEARAQLAAAVAQMHASDVQRAIAEENEQRTRGLFEHGAVSESQLISDRQRLDLARAQLEAARAQADTARSALDNTQLLAPFAGHVTAAPSAAGAIVMPGTVLFRIEDTSSLRLTATISPADAAFAVLGARIEIDSRARQGARDDSVEKSAPESTARGGKITAVLPSVDSQTRRLPIVAEIANGGVAPLLANEFVRATLVPGAPIEVLKFPASVLRPGSQDEVVLADGGRVRIARVAFARADDGSLLVRSGISARDRLLVAPSAQQKDGDALPAVAQ